MESNDVIVESFTLDHTKVIAPYIRISSIITGKGGDKIYKYDVRFKQPNKEFIDVKSIHSLEHMLASYLRKYINDIVDISPMGCLTGFYLIMLNNSSLEQVAIALEKALKDVVSTKEIPAANELQCGNAASHSLEGAIKAAQAMLQARESWLKNLAA